MLARLAHLTARQRWAVIGSWLALTIFGGFAAGQVSKRWLESFSTPASPGVRASSFHSTGSDAYVSEDRHTTFIELYPAGPAQFGTKSGAEQDERWDRRRL